VQGGGGGGHSVAALMWAHALLQAPAGVDDQEGTATARCSAPVQVPLEAGALVASARGSGKEGEQELACIAWLSFLNSQMTATNGIRGTERPQCDAARQRCSPSRDANERRQLPVQPVQGAPDALPHRLIGRLAEQLCREHRGRQAGLRGILERSAVSVRLSDRQLS
jgi:hypothetical protein